MKLVWREWDENVLFTLVVFALSVLLLFHFNAESLCNEQFCAEVSFHFLCLLNWSVIEWYVVATADFFLYALCLLGNINCIFIFNCSRRHLEWLNSHNSNERNWLKSLWKLCAMHQAPCHSSVLLSSEASEEFLWRKKTWFHTIGNKIRYKNSTIFFVHQSWIKLMWSLMSHILDSNVDELLLFCSCFCECLLFFIRMRQLNARFDPFYWQCL